MHVAHILACLHEHRQIIAAMIAQANPLARYRDATHFKELALARWHLLRALRAYQTFEHTEIFDPIIATGPEPRACTVRLLKWASIEVASALDQHVQRWSRRGPITAWSVYRQEAAALADCLERHLAAERRAIEVLLLSPGKQDRPR